jgi:hypothetical protein
MNKKILTFSLLWSFSAIFRALDQLMRWEQEGQSWLPMWVFTWDSGLFAILDAPHVYMGLKLVLFGLGAFVLYPIIKYYDDNLKPESLKWIVLAILVLVYYQVFNLFYHIVFRYPEFWRWPILGV